MMKDAGFGLAISTVNVKMLSAVQHSQLEI